MATLSTVKSNRQLYLDVARCIAIISITFNHAVNRSFDNYGNQMAEFLSIPIASSVLKAVITVFSRIGVPLFLMISGALILTKTIENAADIKRFYKKNLLSLLITTEIWYVLFFWFIVLVLPQNQVLETQGFGGALWGMVQTMLFQNQLTFDSMWYMPMILCLYTTIPFVIIVINKLRPSYGVMLLPAGIVAVNNIILPAINAFLQMQGQPTFSSVLQEAHLVSILYLYILGGYFISQGALAKLKDWLVAVIAGGSFLLCCGYQLYCYAQPMNYLVKDVFPLIYVSAGFLFELLRRKAHHFSKLSRPVTYLSRISFGIYFMHIIVLNLLTTFMDFSAWSQPLKMLFLEVATVGGSILIIAPLSKIKVLRKYLFLIK